MISDPDISPIIVFGAARSGTTYLAHLLNAHPEVFVGDETRVFAWIDTAIYELLRRKGVVFRHRREFRRELKAVLPPIVRNFLRSFKPRARFWGDKNPHYVGRRTCLQAVLRLFPKAHFIHLIRDGRDVVTSGLRGVWTDFDGVHDMWIEHVNKGQEFGSTVPPDQYLELRYEELVRDDLGHAKRIFEFLGIELHPNVAKFCADQQQRRLPFCGPTRDLSQGVTNSDWARVLDPVQQVKSLERLGPHLVRLGYETKETLREKRHALENPLRVDQMRQVVRKIVPKGATVLVMSRGDDDLLALEGRKGSHFPQTVEGDFAGEYPSGSQEAIDHLEMLRRNGASFLLIPDTALWWLRYYDGFREHLHRFHRRRLENSSCALFELLDQPPRDNGQTHDFDEPLRAQSWIPEQSVSVGGEAHKLVVSCLGDDTGGGLFCLEGSTFSRIDRISTAGMFVADGRLARLLWAEAHCSSGELLTYDDRGVDRYYRVDSLGDPHDLIWDGKHFIVVATSTNTILWLSPSGEVVRKWQAPGDGDAWHLNSLLLHEGRLLVSAFGRFNRHREWADGVDKTGIVFDLESGEDVLDGLTRPHTPRFVDGHWLVCNSGTRELIMIEPSTRQVVRRVQLNGWTRGIAVCDDVIFVGESANRLNPAPEATASVAAICRHTWKILDRFPLPCREVYELVAAPDALVEGVRNGFRTNSGRVREQDQHAMFRELGVEPTRLWATGEPLPRDVCRASIRATAPKVLPANSTVELDCVVENLGSAIFVSAPPQPVNLSYRWVRETPGGAPEIIEGARSRLPKSLPPRQPMRCGLLVRTPKSEGTYILRISLVQEYVAWFDEIDPAYGCSLTVRIQFAKVKGAADPKPRTERTLDDVTSVNSGS